ncbi:MAG: hypothetical protein ACLVG5_09795 [Clostridium sp.]
MAEQYENLQAYTRKLEELYNSMRSSRLCQSPDHYVRLYGRKQHERAESYFYQILPISHSFSKTIPAKFSFLYRKSELVHFLQADPGNGAGALL